MIGKGMKKKQTTMNSFFKAAPSSELPTDPASDPISPRTMIPSSPLMISPRPTSAFKPIAKRPAPAPLPLPVPKRTTSNVAIMSDARIQKDKDEIRHSWLERPHDLSQNAPSHPDYDRRTLFIPPYAWKKFTPFERQFWEIKSKHYDTVVFFKKGKFFELYENDASIGHQEFDLKMTDRVNMRMVGVPESSFEHWASQFVAKGYKVAKVEQMENAMGKSIRNNMEGGKVDKIILRELTSILTAGTLVDAGFLTTDQSTYCMSLKEIDLTYGVVLVDTASASFQVAWFEDDADRSMLTTLLTQMRPREIVLEKGCVSKATVKLLKDFVDEMQFNYLTDFWSHTETLAELKGYFPDGPIPVEIDLRNEVSLSAFGGLLSYLKTLKLDRQMITSGNIQKYVPLQSSTLILDAQTLTNLDIFTNSNDGSSNGTLFKFLNHCSTSFGKRLLQKWICHPLMDIKMIDERLDAVDDLTDTPGLLDQLHQTLKGLPDFERIMARIHTGSCLVKDFILMLKELSNLQVNLSSISPPLLRVMLKERISLRFSSDLKERLKYLQGAFDQSEVTKIVLAEGVSDEYDTAKKRVLVSESNLEAYRKEKEKEIKSPVVFRNIGKEINQLEVHANTKVPSSWTLMSKTVKVNRYYSDPLKVLIHDLLEQSEYLVSESKIAKLLLYRHFTHAKIELSSIVTKLSELDCLLSLTLSRANMNTSCRPTLLNSTSTFEAESLACYPNLIPNNLSLDNVVLLTGPNMGGKSTLLRQTCLSVILAQIGSYIPAKSYTISPFDRIFTRIGGNDDIMKGKSTFMIELTETAKILAEATSRSLVIMDELGRGTSTYDGYAIAYAVLHYLLQSISCKALFSTHYLSLTNHFTTSKCTPMYMSYHLSNKKLTFLYTVKQGVAKSSYGMNVARLAGVAEVVVEEAEKISDSMGVMEEISRGAKLELLAGFSALMNGKALESVHDSL